MNKLKKYGLQLLVLALVIVIWELIISIFNISPLLLPRPGIVFDAYVSATASGLLLNHTFITLAEAMAGFAIGAAIGISLGYFLAKSKFIENILSPYIIATQAMPKLALAPLILIWFGFGIWSKIIITALIVFFPIFINMFVAVKSVSPSLKELMHLTKAGRWQIFKKLELPFSLPLLFAGFKTGITLAVVGAVVGEFVGANAGLGYLIMFSTGYLNTAMVFVAIIQLALLGFILYEIISIIGSRLMFWHESEQRAV